MIAGSGYGLVYSDFVFRWLFTFQYVSLSGLSRRVTPLSHAVTQMQICLHLCERVLASILYFEWTSVSCWIKALPLPIVLPLLHCRMWMFCFTPSHSCIFIITSALSFDNVEHMSGISDQYTGGLSTVRLADGSSPVLVLWVPGSARPYNNNSQVASALKPMSNDG